jgi:DinB family protein
MMPVAELESIRQQTDANGERLKGLCAFLSEAQLAWRPRPSSWCIAEVLLHLERTTQVFLPVIDNGIESARRNGHLSNGPFRLGWMGRFYVWYVEPPPRIRLPAPKIIRPLFEGSALDALPRFLQSQELMKQRLDHANGIDIVRTRITSPLASIIKMSLFALFSVGAAHERRHIWQITNIRAQLASRSSL